MNARISCPHCDFTAQIPVERIPPKARFAICPRCRRHFPIRTGAHPSHPAHHATTLSESLPPNTHNSPSPWEDRDRIGLIKGIFRSFLGTLLSPGKFFRTMQTRGSLVEPLAIGVLFGSLGLMLSIFNGFLLSVVGYGDGMRILSNGLESPLLLSTLMLLSPFISCVGIFIVSGVLHLFLRVFRGASMGFEGTFRVVAFGQAAQVLGLIPLLGGLIGIIWYLLVLIVGMREMHQTTYARVLAAFLSPALLLGAAVVAVMVPLIYSLISRLI